MRSFTLVLPEKYSGGRYNTEQPLAAARRAFKQLCLQRPHKCHQRFAIQETTRGGGGAVFYYEGEKVPLQHPKLFPQGGTMRRADYEYRVRALAND